GLEPIIETTDTRGFVTKEYFDQAGRRIKVEAAISSGVWAVTEYTYDLADRLTQVKDPENKVTSYLLGINGRVREIELPGSSLADHLFDYDARGNMIRANYGQGIVYFNYDEWDRLISVDYPGTLDATYSYAFFDESGANGE